jgi:hypothetical protein
MPVARVDGRAFSLKDNPVTRDLRRRYEAEVAADVRPSRAGQSAS